ncbi:MAG: LysR substrate-binding domain-containing protein [Motiliproteus sp.]
MNRLPPLKALQAFRYAAENLSFKVAAERLFVTQAAVSQQIKALEQHLGVSLFRRLTREVVLTPQGQQLLPYISKGFAALEQGVASLSQDPQPDRLTLSVLPSFAGRWLVPRLGSFQQQWPDVNIHLTPNLKLATFDGGDLDLAVRFGRGEYPGLTSKLLQREYLLPVCHPSLLNTALPIEPQLAQLSLLADDGPDMRDVWPQFEQELGVSLQQDSARLYMSDASMLVEALLSGQGFAMLRFSLAYELLQRGQLICPVPIALKSSYDYYLVAPESHFQRPKVMRFENWLRQQIEVIESSWQQFGEQYLDAELRHRLEP